MAKPSEMTVNSIVDLFGGTSALAQALGTAPSTVSSWRLDGIPPGRALQLSALAAKCKLDLTVEAILRSVPHSTQSFLGVPNGQKPRRRALERN
jgi:DNA-binding transcriptional regulator YdaS (Cro superfamily)